MPAEVANILRRGVIAGNLLPADAQGAFEDLLSLTVELYEFGFIAERAWELRNNVTVYDAWYVALAEALGAPVATVDGRLTRASGPTCSFLTPPG